jgi:phage tail-like protein
VANVPAGSHVFVDPTTTFNFGLEIGSVVVAAFTEVSGMSAQMDVFEYKEGGLNEHTHKFPGRTSFGNVTLKWGMTESQDLWDWYLETLRWTSSATGNNPRRDVSVVSFKSGEGKTPASRWNLIDAFPVKWTGPSWNTAQSTIAIESLEIAFRTMDRKK